MQFKNGFKIIFALSIVLLLNSCGKEETAPGPQTPPTSPEAERRQPTPTPTPSPVASPTPTPVVSPTPVPSPIVVPVPPPAVTPVPVPSPVTPVPPPVVTPPTPVPATPTFLVGTTARTSHNWVKMNNAHPEQKVTKLFFIHHGREKMSLSRLNIYFATSHLTFQDAVEVEPEQEVEVWLGVEDKIEYLSFYLNGYTENLEVRAQ